MASRRCPQSEQKDADDVEAIAEVFFFVVFSEEGSSPIPTEGVACSDEHLCLFLVLAADAGNEAPAVAEVVSMPKAVAIGSKALLTSFTCRRLVGVS